MREVFIKSGGGEGLHGGALHEVCMEGETPLEIRSTGSQYAPLIFVVFRM